ncbi:type II toxin-antitoxin system prevent-host-death family antitoxin [Methylobacterium sp. J-077]|uniref:type II toxin-antitoxin system prevent-host-death family antitoxin n=1 Tax=Methylobacterium sp. J-077 TaxID=2836656 RepID=UPI00391DC077
MTTGAVQPSSQSGAWCFQDAKARFGEVVQRACTAGPQCVIGPGQEAVVIISAVEFRRLTGPLTGQSLIDALQASPFRDIDLESEPVAIPARDAGF